MDARFRLVVDASSIHAAAATAASVRAAALRCTGSGAASLPNATGAAAHRKRRRRHTAAVASRFRRGDVAMAGYDPGEMNSLFCDVMKHSGKFSDVTSDEGAANFNQMFFAKPLPEAEAEQATPLSIEVIDSVVRKESGVIAGIGDKVHVEYIIAIKRGLLLKTLGKRYSELHEFHNLLVEHKLIDKIKAPPFPEKQSFRDGWYKFDSTDTSSDFVRARRASLDRYLQRLFDEFPTLYHEPCVIAFFGIEEFEFQAAQEVSAAAARAAELEKKRAESTHDHDLKLQPDAPAMPQANEQGFFDV